jgi:hypothetical protein
MPKCYKCTGNPEMKIIKTEKLLASVRPGTSYGVAKSGHPVLAIFATVFSLISKVTNEFFNEVTYECELCKDRKSVTEKV